MTSTCIRGWVTYYETWHCVSLPILCQKQVVRLGKKISENLLKFSKLRRIASVVGKKQRWIGLEKLWWIEDFCCECVCVDWHYNHHLSTNRTKTQRLESPFIRRQSVRHSTTFGLFSLPLFDSTTFAWRNSVYSDWDNYPTIFQIVFPPFGCCHSCHLDIFPGLEALFFAYYSTTAPCLNPGGLIEIVRRPSNICLTYY